MFNNIYMLLDQLGLNTQKRTLHIQFSNAQLTKQVFLQCIEGDNELNLGNQADLWCVSTQANIELKQFVGCQVAVDQITERGALFRTTGIITQALQHPNDGPLAVYQLTLQDATSLWHKRRNSRVFMNKSVVEITQILFKEWQQQSALFAASLTLDCAGLNQTYDTRPLSIQYNETDWAYLQRLWQSEGINYFIDEAQLTVAQHSAPIQAQVLRLIDDNQYFSQLDRQTIAYQPNRANEQSDAIRSLTAKRQLQPTAVHVQRWQADALTQEDGSGSVLSPHQHSEQYRNEKLYLEDAWAISPAWISDLNGEDQATASHHQQLTRLNQQISDFHALQSKQFQAISDVRDTQIGYWFTLTHHPELVKNHTARDCEFLILGKHYQLHNNLPQDLAQHISTLLPPFATAEQQVIQLTLVRRYIKVVPCFNAQPLPTARPQHARVVGVDGEEIHVDAWGRIKVRFLFTRTEHHAHDGGAGSNENDSDSAWVDVLTPWAGEGFGARFLPRVGELVVIDFFEGNIDRPYVTGRIHEAERYPTQFDQLGQLGDTKKLSGIRSKEVGGEGFNQLRLDDTPAQISAQLHSSHAASQLNLGHLSHPKANDQSDSRGEGFELRTDAWGAVRASEGLYITSHTQTEAKDVHLGSNEPKQQLQSNFNDAKALSEIAENQQTDPLQALDHLKNFVAQLKQQDATQAASFEQALLLLAAPNSVAISSHEDIHLSSDAQLNQIAADSINWSSQQNIVAHASEKISLLAAQKGMKQVAGKGNIELQAQSDALDLIAKLAVKITSTEDKIHFTSPKGIVLQAKQSKIKIGQGIELCTSQVIDSKAGQHIFQSSVAISTPVIDLPDCSAKQTQAAQNGSAKVDLS